MTRARTTVQSALADLYACCELVFTGFPVHDIAMNKGVDHFSTDTSVKIVLNDGVAEPLNSVNHGIARASKHDT